MSLKKKPAYKPKKAAKKAVKKPLSKVVDEAISRTIKKAKGKAKSAIDGKFVSAKTVKNNPATTFTTKPSKNDRIVKEIKKVLKRYDYMAITKLLHIAKLVGFKNYKN